MNKIPVVSFVLLALTCLACSRAESNPAPVERAVSDPPAFGPVLGKVAKVTVPGPGKYAGAFDFSQSKYPTREIYQSADISGRFMLTLESDQTASACLAYRVREHGSQSKYISPDRKHHSSESTRKLLLGATGKWSAGKSGVRVILDKTRDNACPAGKDAEARYSPIQLDCLQIGKTDRLPVDVLACRFQGGPGGLNSIGLDLGENSRAGPWTLRRDPQRRSLTVDDTGRLGPWLLAGGSPGLKVESRDGRDDASPQVSFSAEKVSLVPANYRERR